MIGSDAIDVQVRQVGQFALLVLVSGFEQHALEEFLAWRPAVLRPVEESVVARRSVER
jgi:hypothetical protein